jgi:hypothetical protein
MPQDASDSESEAEVEAAGSEGESEAEEVDENEASDDESDGSAKKKKAKSKKGKRDPNAPKRKLKKNMTEEELEGIVAFHPLSGSTWAQSCVFDACVCAFASRE